MNEKLAIGSASGTKLGSATDTVESILQNDTRKATRTPYDSRDIFLDMP